MGKRIAIRGHSTRGNEVIEILEMMGGKNIHKYDVIRDDYVYFLSEKGSILAIPRCNIHLFYCVIFTLEEFLEKYPYKVGDKVVYEDDNDIVVISEIMWDDTVGDIFYNVKRIDEDDCFLCPPELLKPYKETNMNENKISTANELPTFEPMFKMNDEIEYKIPDGYEITEVSKDKVFIKPIKPKYPKTYKECCDVLLIPPYYNLRYHTYEHCYNEYATSNTLLSLQDKLNTLGKLLICRDAYWKIAGEQMGLGKPWEPDWTNLDQLKYCIWVDVGEIITMTNVRGQHILAFPTEEIRDAFYEDFKHLIEQCKKFL